MRILSAAGHSRQQGGAICLILLNKVWHVVARGYLCQAADAEEGRRVIAALQVSCKSKNLHIDKP